jgi:predicted metal-dependent phosphoesterase TrpH
MNKQNRIVFEKPNIEELRKDYTTVDMHMHSIHSDGINKVNALVRKAKKLGSGIAIIDHNEIKGAIELDNHKSILTIPGIEATSKEGTHLLVYFYNIDDLRKFYKDYVKPNMGSDKMSPLNLTMEELIKGAKKFKSLVIFPHPYSIAFTGVCNYEFPPDRREKIMEMVDGVEVINSENLRKWNVKCALLGFNLDKCIVGGSDGHTLYHMGKVVTYAKCYPDRKSFLNAIKRKKNKVIGREIDMLRKVTVNTFKLKTNLKNYPDIIERNLRYNYRVIDSKTKEIKEKVKDKLGMNGS